MSRRKGQLQQLAIPSALILLCLGILMNQQCRTLKTALPYWPLPPWEELTALRIDRPNTEGSARSLEFKHQGGQWILSTLDRPAGKEEMAPLKNLINTLQPVDILAEKGPYTRFGLNPGELITLSLVSGDREETILVGNRSPSGNYSYVRRQDDPAVYSVRGDLAELLNKSGASYRNRQILSFKEEEVSALIFKKDNMMSTFSRKGEGWISDRNVPFDKGELENYLKRMGQLKCLSFLPENPEGSRPPDSLLTVIIVTNQQQTLTILGENENAFIAEAEGVPDAFLIPRFDGQFLWSLSGF